MEDAYVIGIRLALENGVSAGIATIAADLATLDGAIATTTANLQRLQATAATRDLSPRPPQRRADPSVTVSPDMTTLPATVPTPNITVTLPPQPEPTRIAPTHVAPSAPQQNSARPRASPAAVAGEGLGEGGRATPIVPNPPVSSSAPIPTAAPNPIAAALPALVAPPPTPAARATTDAMRLTAAPPAPAAQPRPPEPAAPYERLQAAPTLRQIVAPSSPDPATIISAAPFPNAPIAPTAPSQAPAAAYPTAPAAPPPRETPAGAMHGDVYLDGAKLGRWMADRLARDTGGPQTGTTGFDPRLGPSWPGPLQGY